MNFLCPHSWLLIIVYLIWFLFNPVALNYQTWGTEMFLNEAQFNQNGRCGYVLKPDFLRPGEVVKPSTVQKKLELTILSGQHIPKPGQNVEGEGNW